MSDALVTLDGVDVILGGKHVLQGIDATIERGKVTALVGPNGSGKTTILKAVLKEVPYTGRITFHCGHDHTRALPTQIGYLPQKLQVDAKLPMTVRDFFALALQRRPLFLGVSRRVEKTMLHLLSQVLLPPSLLDQPVEKLSGGEMQRVLLALALEPSPELLLLDEPAQGVDRGNVENFYQLIGRLNRDLGVTVLLVVHELATVQSHAHQVFCLKEGQIKYHGDPRAVLTNEVLGDLFGLPLLHHADVLGRETTTTVTRDG